MADIFKKKSKDEIPTGSVRGIKKESAVYKRVDANCKESTSVREEENEDHAPSVIEVTEIDNQQYVTFDAKGDDGIRSPTYKLRRSEVTSWSNFSHNMTNEGDTNVDHEVSPDSHTSHEYIKYQEETENSEDGFHLINTCRHCGTCLHKENDRQSICNPEMQTVETQCEAMDGSIESDEIDTLFDTLSVCYKSVTGQTEVCGVNKPQFYDLHNRIRDALLQLYSIQDFVHKLRSSKDLHQTKRVRDKFMHRVKKPNRAKSVEEDTSTYNEIPNVDRVEMELVSHKRKLEEVTVQKDALKEALEAQLQKNAYMSSKISTLEDEKEEALTRLSNIAGSLLREGNPAITDLNDDNRPINIAERFSELYDNEWSDAYEKLVEEHEERGSIEILLEISKSVFTMCRIMSELQVRKLESLGIDEVTPKDEIKSNEYTRRAKDFQISSGHLSSHLVKKKILMDKDFQDKFGDNLERCEAFVSTCIDICWLMNIQEVPMHLCYDLEKEKVLNKDCYREYTKCGTICDFLVWPIVQLHVDGPIMQKGIVQPI